MTVFDHEKSGRLMRLESQIAKLMARKSAAEQKEKARRRKLDNRRKILVGAMILGWMENDERLRDKVLKGLDGFLTRALDRKVFGFEVKEPGSNGGSREAKPTENKPT